MTEPKPNAAQKKYEAKRVLKHVSFNTEQEADLLAFVQSVEFSRWVKDKIRQELEK